MNVQDPVTVFVGYDAGEAAAYTACCQSLIAQSSLPLAIHPVALNLFDGFYKESHRDGSTAFTYTRFLIPYLCQFRNEHAIWLDGDMVVRGDIAELWNMRRWNVGVQVVKHDYRTKYPRKFRGAANADYPRKNWSSVVLWNCGFGGNRDLTPDYIAEKDGAFLHRFGWLKDEQIGDLPAAWNHLTMEYPANPEAKLYHYTIGTPCFPEYAEQEGAVEWRQHLRAAIAPLPAG